MNLQNYETNMILITGASRGIGRSLAIQYSKFYGNKIKLALIARDENNLKETSNICSKFNTETLIIPADISQKSEVKRVVEICKNSNSKIILSYLNAGISFRDSYENYDSSKLLKIFETNLFSAAYFLEYLIPILKEYIAEDTSINKENIRDFNKYKIIGVSSLADSRGMPFNSSYCASKAAFTHLLEAARIELKKIGISVVSVRPGFIKTDMTSKNEYYMPFLMTPEKAAEIIIQKVESGATRISFPMFTTMLSYIGRLTPSTIFEKVMSYRKKPMIES